MSTLPPKSSKAPAEPNRDPACHDDVCITCSDQAAEVRVLELLENSMAKVDTGTSIEEVSVGLIDVSVGDVVLVHAKVAIGKRQ
jgi:hydrogenase expression/formation protein HypC